MSHSPSPPTGPDRHVPAEGEEDAELSGALRPSAGVLPGVGHGEENVWIGRTSHDVLSVFPHVELVLSVAASAVSDSGGRLHFWSLHGHSGPAGLSSGHQHIRLLSGKKRFVSATFQSSL